MTLTCACAALAALAWTAPGNAAAPVVLDSSDAEIEVSAHDGRLAWWRLDSASGEFKMVTAVQGQPPETAAAAGLGSLPRGFDLGPDESGSTIAVYARCRDPVAQRDCDIYRYDFGTRTEEAVDGLASRRFNETYPSVWRGSIAFARSGRKGKARFARIYVLKKGRLTHLEGGWYEFGPGDGPTGMDLRGNRLAYVWRRDGGEIEDYELRVVPTSGRPGRTVQRVGHGGAGFNALLDPVFVDSATLMWLDQGFEGKYDLRNFNMASGEYGLADPLDLGSCASGDRDVAAIADGGATEFAYVVRCSETYTLLQTVRPSFHRSGARPPARERRARQPSSCELGGRSLCRKRA